MSRALTSLDAFTRLVPEVTLFAGAARNADARANGIWVFACAITAFAWTEFLVFAADLRSDWHDEFRMDWLLLMRALAGFNAFARIVPEETFLAGATGHADARANRIRVLASAIATFA